MIRTVSNPPSRFPVATISWDEPPVPRLEIIEDHSKSILSENDSPDIGFTWSVNAYRGCTHACAYCYARAFHEYLELGAGTDFERRLVIKPRAPELLEQAFNKPSWRGERVAFSGVTDCYQPIERRYELTRRCIEVCARYRNPVAVITRSPLVVRDLDLLVELAEHDAAQVSLSIPILDLDVQRKLEPGAPPPAARLQAISRLAEAGVPVGVSLAPLIPGINDRSIPATLQAARDAGARWAWMSLVRLSPSVAAVFEERLRDAMPDAADAVLRKIQRARGTTTREFRFFERMSGQGEVWETTRRMFELWRDRLGFAPTPPCGPTPFRRPGAAVQLALFR
jgi:DNA repair photolyase